MNATGQSANASLLHPTIPLDLNAVLNALGGEGGAGKRCPPGVDSWWCVDTYKIDAQVYASMIVSSVVGALCFAAFCVLQSYVSVFRARLLNPNVAIKPPVCRHRGVLKYFYWFWITCTLSEKELLATAGMDALMFERLIVFSLQLMTPITVLSLSILLPIHSTSNYVDVAVNGTQEVTSSLMRLTMSNMWPYARGDNPSSNDGGNCSLLWVHFFLVLLYTLYAMWLLDGHYRWYVLLRQHYLTMGDSVSPWLGHAVAPHHADGTAVQLAAPPRGDDGAISPTGLMLSADGRAIGEAGAGRGAAAGGGGGGAYAAPRQQELEMADRRGRGREAAAQALLDSTAGAGGPTSPSPRPTASTLTSRQSSSRQLLPGDAPASESFFAAFPGPEALLGESDGDLGPVGINLRAASSHRLDGGGGSLKLPGFLRALSGHNLNQIGSSGGGGTAGGRTHSMSRRRGRTPGPGGAALLEGTSGDGSPTGPSPGLSSPTDGPSPTSGGPAGDESSPTCPLPPGAAIESFDEQEAAEEAAWRASKAAAARVKAATAETGADRPWWEFKTGDPLLDRHISRVDAEEELAWVHAGPDVPPLPQGAERLQKWWETAPREPSDAQEDIEAVPGTKLVFDHRSLRARRPSVRFRNTINVMAPNGRSIPLHVSNYAVLVTDVPDLLAEDDGEGDRPPHPFCSLARCAVWHWPCLLSADDMEALSRRWSKARSRKHIKDLARASVQPGGGGGGTSQQESRQRTGEEGVVPGAAAAAAAAGNGAAEHPPLSPPRSEKLERPPSGLRGEALAGASRMRLVERTFAQLFPDDYHCTVPVLQHKELDELLRRWDRELRTYIQGRALVERKIERRARREERRRARRAASGGGEGEGSVAVRSGCAGGQGGCGKGGCGKDGCGKGGGGCAGGGCGGGGCAGGGCGGGGCSGGCVGRIGCMGRRRSSTRHTSATSSEGAPDTIVADESSESEGEDEEGGTVCCGSAARRCCQLPCWRPVLPKLEQLEQQRQGLLALESQIIQAQREALDGAPTGSFIVLFKTPQAATLAARSSVFPQQQVHGGGARGGEAGSEARMGLDAFRVQQAPGPEDVLWQSLWKPWKERRAALAATIPCYLFLYLFPTGFFSAVANNLMFFVCRPSQPILGGLNWFCDSKLLQFPITVILPFVGLMLWQNMIIPQHLYRLELKRGHATSLSEMERSMLAIYFGWEVINLFLGGVLSSSLLTQVQVLVDNPQQWPAVLGRTFPNSSNFFLNYTIMRAFLMNMFRLITPHGGMWRWIGQMLFTGCTGVGHAATERYRAFITYPASIRYGREPGLVLLILLIGVAFSVVAPLMAPFALAYMATAWLLWRYQILYVCVRCYESGGRMWTLYFRIINWCLALFIVFTSCIFLLKKANLQATLALCLLPGLFYFSRRCHARYDAAVESMPLWLAHAAPRTDVDPSVYTAPALRPGARGWFFESGKAWVRWGVPLYGKV